MTKPFYAFIALLIICSCSEQHYDKIFYQKISGIKIPQKAKTIESIDNGEFVTTTVFEVNSGDLKNFIAAYNFSKVEKPFYLTLYGNPSLQKNRIDYSKMKNCYYKAGTKGKNSWFYLVDADNNKIWAEIQYPDKNGD